MSDAHPGSADRADAAPSPTYQPTPADVPPPTYQPTAAGSAPSGQPIRFARGTIIEIDAHHYTVSVRIPGESDPSTGISYNPQAYIPRLDEEVGILLNETSAWVLGANSWLMYGSPTYGRAPSAALWRDSNWPVESDIKNLHAVRMDHKAWDTDHMLIELGDGQTTTMITPQRTGVYTIKAGGRWDRDPQARGRRSMDLRWVDGAVIARDEKAPDSVGHCSHSVSADIRITTSIDPAHASPWVRPLGAAVELVVFQSSGQPLSLMADVDPKPFLQITYQGPMP